MGTTNTIPPPPPINHPNINDAASTQCCSSITSWPTTTTSSSSSPSPPPPPTTTPNTTYTYITHLQSLYQTPLTQTIILGLVFHLIFMDFICIQAYASTNYGDSLAANTCTTIFLTFAATCLVSPGVTNKLGVKLTLFLGSLGFCLFILFSLAYFESFTTEDGGKGDWLVIVGAVIVGMSTAFLWNAEGRLILQYASIAESGGGGGGEEEEEGRMNVKTGTLLGVFWSLFQGSSLSGGLIAFFAYSSDDDNNSHAVLMYTIFFFITLVGAFSSFLLLSPSYLEKCHSNSSRWGSNNNNNCGRETTAPPRSKVPDSSNGNSHGYNIDYRDYRIVEDKTALMDDEIPSRDTNTLRDQLLPQNYNNNNSSNNNNHHYFIESDNNETSHESWWEESKQTLALFKSKRMMLHFALLFFYTGFTQPYQIETFGNRFFEEQTLGLELMIFYSAEIVSGFLVGKVLDGGEDEEEEDGDNDDNGCRNNNNNNNNNECEMSSPSPLLHRSISCQSITDDINNAPPNHNDRTSSSPRRRAAKKCLLVVVIITLLGNIIAISEEIKYSSYTHDKTNIALYYYDLPAILSPTLAFACWGFSDGFVQTYCYWLMGYLFKEGDVQARAVGFYRCMQSLGWAAGCALIPTARLSPLGQVGLICAVFGGGVVLSLSELPV